MSRRHLSYVRLTYGVRVMVSGWGMGRRNYLIEGVSGTGKTSVATQLQHRAYHVIHGDRELAIKGDPQTGEPISGSTIEQRRLDIAFGHKHHVWPVERVKAIVDDHRHPVTFFCGGSRNYRQFIALFDAVYVLEIDRDTLVRRLAARPSDEFGSAPSERDIVLRLHETREDMPPGIGIDATAPLRDVVDVILARCGL